MDTQIVPVEAKPLPPPFDPLTLVRPRKWQYDEKQELLSALCRFAAKDSQYRWNIAAVNFEPACAVATNGHCLLVVRDFPADVAEGSLSVTSGKFTPWRPTLRFAREAQSGARAGRLVRPPTTSRTA